MEYKKLMEEADLLFSDIEACETPEQLKNLAAVTQTEYTWPNEFNCYMLITALTGFFPHKSVMGVQYSRLFLHTSIILKKQGKDPISYLRGLEPLKITTKEEF